MALNIRQKQAGESWQEGSDRATPLEPQSHSPGLPPHAEAAALTPMQMRWCACCISTPRPRAPGGAGRICTRCSSSMQPPRWGARGGGSPEGEDQVQATMGHA